jgi:rubrerythrin
MAALSRRTIAKISVPALSQSAERFSREIEPRASASRDERWRLAPPPKGGLTMSTNPQDLMKIAAQRVVDGHFQDMYNEEQSEAIWDYLLAEKAEAEGYPDVAEILREVARDELKHALWMGQIAEKRRLEGNSLAGHLKNAMNGDNNVVSREREIAQMARLLGREADAARFEQMATDELDHVHKYQQALELLQKRNGRREGR